MPVTDEEEGDLLGGIPANSSEEIEVPDELIDQVIGQEDAVEVVKNAAEQRRHVMMIGSPGTGKSMLAKAMSEMMPKEEAQDILVYKNDKDENEPRIRQVPAGKGKEVIEAHKEEEQKRSQARRFLKLLIVLVILGAGVLQGQIFFAIVAAIIAYVALSYLENRGGKSEDIPRLLIDRSEEEAAPFENATGAHQGALLGDVRHDPFQSGGMGTPPHHRIEAGAIHKASGGVLFIDEINTLDIRSQQQLMTSIQEGEFSITGQSERSSGAMVQTEPVPTDFIMIAAGNMDAMENMHPALRSRIKGYGYEVYMDDTVDDSPEMRQKFARFIAQEVDKDDNIPPFSRRAMEEVVLEAKRRSGQKGKLTLKLRDLGGLVRVAGDTARKQDKNIVEREDVVQAKERARGIEQQLADKVIERRKEYEMNIPVDEAVGRVNGLAVMGEESGIMLPVMANVTNSQGPPEVIATGKLKEMAEESVQNVSAIIKEVSEKPLEDKDIHIQFIQPGQQGVDGPSASITIATAVLSSLEDAPVKQNVAMTGSLSVRGDVLPVGGVTHKIEAAVKAGCDTVIIPRANEDDVMIEDEYKDEVRIVPVGHISEVLDVALAGDRSALLDRLNEVSSSRRPEVITP